MANVVAGSPLFSAMWEDEAGAQRYAALGGSHVLFDKLPLASLSALKPGEVLELRGSFHDAPRDDLDRAGDARAIRGMVGFERERFVAYGIRAASGELCVELPKHADYPIAIVKAARIVSEDDVPDEALRRIKTAEVEANPPAESLEKMGAALEDLLR